MKVLSAIVPLPPLRHEPRPPTRAGWHTLVAGQREHWFNESGRALCLTWSAVEQLPVKDEPGLLADGVTSAACATCLKKLAAKANDKRGKWDREAKWPGLAERNEQRRARTYAARGGVASSPDLRGGAGGSVGLNKRLLGRAIGGAKAVD